MVGLNIGKMRAFGEALLSMAKSQAGQITIIVAAVLGTLAIITSITDAWQKEAEIIEDKIKVNEEKIQQYQKEIESLEKLQKQLQEAKDDTQAVASIRGLKL